LPNAAAPRDGKAALDRFAEREPTLYVRLVAILHPELVRRAVEDHLLDEGLTTADLRALYEKAIRERKH
jgi:hypothetical protein